MTGLKFKPWRWAKADTRAAEAISALSAVAWGVIMALPGDTMASPVWRIMRLIGDDHFWAVIFGIAGVLQALAIFSDAALFRKAGVLLTLMLWFMVSFTSMLSNYLAPGWMVYGILGLAMLWTLLSGPTFDGDESKPNA